MLSPAENPLCVGHMGPRHQFLQAFHAQRLPPSWIIVGPEGVGKRTFCYQLIRLLLSGQTNLSPQDPLFRRITSRSHGDLLVLEKHETVTGLGVEDIRSVQSFLQKTPAEGGWRVVLLDGLETLNRFGTNALLKSLEEPPPQTLFLLTAQTLRGLLPTLRSRCQVLFLKPLEDACVEEALQQMGYALPPQDKSFILSLAQGCIGKAVFFLQEERWKKIAVFRTCLVRACLPTAHPNYRAPFSPENITLWTGEPLSFWGEAIIAWLEDLLKKGSGLQVAPLEEKEVFEQASVALWWHRLDHIKAQFHRGRQFHLDPLHTLACFFHFLTI